MAALIILAYSRPYANINDDILSGVFISIECSAFLVALIIISGISDTEGYNTSALYSTIFIVLLMALGCMVPLTLAMKFTFFRTRFQRGLSYVESVLNVKIHRLDAKSRNEEDLEEMYRMSVSAIDIGAYRNTTDRLTNIEMTTGIVRASDDMSMNPVHM
jgi:hypothetical protein